MMKTLSITKAKKLLAGVFFFTFSIVGYAQSLDKAKLDQFFDRLAEKNKAMGSLVIAKDGNLLYARAIGYSQVSQTEKKPNSQSTKYRIGSVTKMFTATMVYQLIEEGKLKFDDPLSKFFPLVPNATKITIGNILAHRSGIREASENLQGRRTTLVTKDEMFAVIAKSKPKFEPDSTYSYSNTGYFILGNIIEKVTGKSYNEVLKERITAKLGLNDTYLGTTNIDFTKNESYSYLYTNDWQPFAETHTSILFGSGAMISTPKDMAGFIRGIFDLKLMSQKSLDKMKQIKSGLDTFTYHGRTFYGHTGGVDNFGAWLVYLPEEKLVVSYATNGKVYSVGKIMDGIFDIYYNKPFTVPSFDLLAISPEILDKYVGVYSNPEAPVKFTITRKDATIQVQLNNQPPIPLEPTADDKFKSEGLRLELQFNAEKKQMTIIRNGGERVFTKEN